MKKIHELDRHQTKVLDDMGSRLLHVAIDKANKKFGHGIARTNDFGFKSGENMCLDVSMEVRTHLRIVKNS